MSAEMKHRVFILIALWALLAFLAWHYENQCGVFFSRACMLQFWHGMRWFILLKWVHAYQTLIGGLAAVVAGAFVLLAARQTSADSEKAENARRRQNAIVACSLVADEFRDAKVWLGSPSQFLVRQSRPLFTQTTLNIALLHSIDLTLGSAVSALKRDIEEYLASNDVRYINNVTAKCCVGYRLVLAVSERVEPDGTFNLSGGSRLPASYLKEELAALQIPPRSLVGYYSLFDWKSEVDSHHD